MLLKIKEKLKVSKKLEKKLSHQNLDDMSHRETVKRFQKMIKQGRMYFTEMIEEGYDPVEMSQVFIGIGRECLVDIYGHEFADVYLATQLKELQKEPNNITIH